MPINVVQLRPFPFTLASQLVLLFFARHPPIAAPVHVGGIVLKVEFGLVVREAVVTITAPVAILRLLVISAIAPFVVRPVERMPVAGVASFFGEFDLRNMV